MHKYKLSNKTSAQEVEPTPSISGGNMWPPSTIYEICKNTCPILYSLLKSGHLNLVPLHGSASP